VLAGNYAVNPSTEDSNHHGDVRIDQYINPANTMFGRFSGPWGMTTVDLTVHVRSLPPAGYDDWCLVRFRSVASTAGFCEEDGEIWSRDGQLLAQSRQLAALIPVR